MTFAVSAVSIESNPVYRFFYALAEDWSPPVAVLMDIAEKYPKTAGVLSVCFVCGVVVLGYRRLRARNNERPCALARERAIGFGLFYFYATEKLLRIPLSEQKKDETNP